MTIDVHRSVVGEASVVSQQSALTNLTTFLQTKNNQQIVVVPGKEERVEREGREAERQTEKE